MTEVIQVQQVQDEDTGIVHRIPAEIPTMLDASQRVEVIGGGYRWNGVIGITQLSSHPAEEEPPRVSQR